MIELLCQSLSADRMMKDLGEFARRVKLSGTAEELTSFRYIQSHLDAYGFPRAPCSKTLSRIPLTGPSNSANFRASKNRS
jgi:hypothetical protein